MNGNRRNTEENRALLQQDSAKRSHDYDSVVSSPDSTSAVISFKRMICMLSTAFSYGCMLTTLFLITLPVECERIYLSSSGGSPKSVALGGFVCIAGVTQLISPLVGRWSDMYHPPAEYLGQRLPHYFVGLIWTVLGLLGQTFASLYELWILYAAAFFATMLGINVVYAMMLAILADQVPAKQVGTANGILAFQLVTGSIFGFGLFHTLLQQDISNMYYLYAGCVLAAGVLTMTFAHEKDATFAWAERTEPPQHHISFLQSLVDPIVTPNDSPWWQSYTIDVNSDFFFVTLSRLFYYCGNSVQTFFLYFLHDIIRVQDKSGANPEAAVAQLAMLGQLSGAAVCYPIGFFSDYIGRDRRPIVYMSCAVFSACLLCMIAATSMNNMVVLCSVLGAANGVYLTMETSLAVDTLPKSRSSSQLAELAKKEEGSNAKGSAQLLGIWGVAAFLGSALGPMVGGPLLYLFGKQDDGDGEGEETDEYSLRGYAVVLSLSAFYFFCSAWSLRYIRKPNGNAEV